MTISLQTESIQLREPGRPFPFARSAALEAGTAAARGLAVTPRTAKEGPIANFMFATGIENSIPTINGGRTRVDQMEVCGHYRRWRDDFDLVEELGIHFLRYGPPLHRTFLGPGQLRLGIRRRHLRRSRSGATSRRSSTSAISACPTGSAISRTRISRMQFARYAGAFAERFPWVQLYTPVNEMFICAVFSAKYGWWNEQLKTDRTLRHRAQAYRQGQCAGDDRDLEAPARRHLHPERNPRNISTPTARPRSARPRS